MASWPLLTTSVRGIKVNLFRAIKFCWRNIKNKQICIYAVTKIDGPKCSLSTYYTCSCVEYTSLIIVSLELLLVEVKSILVLLTSLVELQGVNNSHLGNRWLDLLGRFLCRTGLTFCLAKSNRNREAGTTLDYHTCLVQASCK